MRNSDVQFKIRKCENMQISALMDNRVSFHSVARLKRCKENLAKMLKPIDIPRTSFIKLLLY